MAPEREVIKARIVCRDYSLSFNFQKFISYLFKIRERGDV